METFLEIVGLALLVVVIVAFSEYKEPIDKWVRYKLEVPSDCQQLPKPTK